MNKKYFSSCIKSVNITKVDQIDLTQKCKTLLQFSAVAVLSLISSCDKKVEKVEIAHNKNEDSLKIATATESYAAKKSADSALVIKNVPAKIEKEIAEIEPPKLKRLLPPLVLKEIYTEPTSRSYPPDMIPVQVDKPKEYTPEAAPVTETPPSVRVPTTQDPMVK